MVRPVIPGLSVIAAAHYARFVFIHVTIYQGDFIMAKQIKIFVVRYGPEEIIKTERELADLVNNGWKIVASGGGGAGFVILQKD